MLHLCSEIWEFALILVLCSQDMPFPLKDLSSSIVCFIQMVFLFNLTQLHCELRNSISYFFKNTLQLLTILKLHIVTVTAYFLWKSVSPASLNAKTIQWSAHLLSSSLQWLWYLVFNYNLLSWSLSELFHTNPFLLQRNPVHLYFGENPGHHLLLLRICAGLKTNLLTILYVSKLPFVSWTVGNLYTMPLIGIIILVFCLV